MSPLDKPIILVVDDDPAVLSAIRFSLEAGGYRVRACADRLSAIEAAADGAPRCLVIDYRLSEGDGLRLAAELRERGCAVPLMLITSQPDRRCRREAQRAQAVIVEKPLLGDTLHEAIARLLRTV